MKKFPKIKRLGEVESIDGAENVEVQEKMDGANFRFTYLPDEDRLVFGSRNVEYYHDGNQPIPLKQKAQYTLGKLMDRVLLGNIETSPQNHTDKNFRHAIEYVRENIDMEYLKEYVDIHGQITFFGEAMHPHTIDYNWDDVPSFLGFGIYSKRYDSWTHPDEMERVYEELNLETVPRLYFGPPSEYDFEDIPESQYADGTAEGIVVKTQEGTMAKLRSEEFKEVNHSSSGASDPSKERPDEVVLAEKYATEPRILKEIHKMEDEGYIVQMKMMEDLWRRVFEDIIEEEFDSIFLGQYSIRTKDFRSEVASRTAQILESYLSRPDGSVLNEAPA
ncbi:MAG: RNA ligase family protein [Halobacteriaceae archaeon]